MAKKKEKPLTRKDVIKLIKENGGRTVGLDLSGKYFEEGVDLSGLDLKGIILKSAHLEGATLMDTQLKGADLGGANLEKADLSVANLEKADLRDAYLEGADLMGANLEGADLRYAHLEGAYLEGVEFPRDTRLDDVDWGNYILGEERIRGFVSEDTYRRLKIWYTEHGIYDVAGKFFYREKEAERKGASRWNNRMAGWLSWAFFGHGEGWKRLLFWIAGFILAFAFTYFCLGTLTPNTFLSSLYYSAVSFIALGYGQWAPQPAGWVKGLGVFETFLGFFVMTLLLVTFVRKWTR